MTTIEELGRRAKQASRHMNRMGTTQKNQILALAAQALVPWKIRLVKSSVLPFVQMVLKSAKRECLSAS